MLSLQHNVVPKLHGWLEETIQKMLGEADEDLITFISDKLKVGCTPTTLSADVNIVFDRDTDAFVQQLWVEMLFQCLLAEEPDA